VTQLEDKEDPVKLIDFPAEQELQLVDPATDWYLPVEHDVQELAALAE